MRPCNRYILIKPLVEKEKEETTVLVPDNFRAKKSSFIKAKVIDWAEDVNISLHENAVIVINSGMIEEIDINDEKHHLILENYVLGQF
jgi:co-chaperonin GroES (HSP10)